MIAARPATAPSHAMPKCSSLSLYYKVLLQYYSVLQSTTPVLVCTTKSTPVLLCTTKYYSSTSLYYKVVLQYYSILHSSTPVLLYTTQIYSSTTHKKWHSNITKCCACHAKWLASSILVTYETLFTMRGGTGITRQPHQILPLPRKMTLMIDVRRIWNVIYNMRSNRHHPPTSPNTAPATQNCTPKSKTNLPKTAEASIPMRGRFEHDPSMIRAWTRHLAPARSPRLLFALRRRILYWKLQHFALGLSTQISPNTAPATKSDTPRSPNAAPATKNDIPRSPNTAPVTKSETPRSPNTAPATKNDAHHWLSSLMKRHLQCAEQQASPSNLTKYCACHAKLHSKIKDKFAENSWSVNSNAGTIRAWSEHELVISHPPVRRGYFSRFGDAFCIENYNVSRSGYLPSVHRILCLPRKVTLRHHQMLRLPRKMTLQHHQMLRLPRKVTLQDHQILRLPRKMMRIIDCRHLWNVIYNARSNRHHPPTSGLNCYWTDLLLNCYWTELLLNWAVTELLLDCYWTDLLLDWTELLLNCYWTVTELTCYWTVTELSCYWTVTGLLLN